MNKKINLSVGIPAYNEEDNISQLISSVREQKEDNYVLREIIVVSDGSTDQTINLVHLIKDPRVKLIVGKSRLGKPSRVNQIFKLSSGDILVLLDADGFLGSNMVFNQIANSFNKNRRLSLLLLRALPLPAETWVENAINNFFYARDSLIKEFDYRKTVFAARGIGLVLSRGLINNLNLPKIVLNDDTFIYLTCKWRKLPVDYNSRAIVWYRSAQSLEDYRKQIIRYIIGGLQMKRFFDQSFLDSESRMPKKVLLKILFLQLKKDPIKYLLLRLNTQYCHSYVKLVRNSETVKWSMAVTSKKLLLNNHVINIPSYNFREVFSLLLQSRNSMLSDFAGKLHNIKIIKS